MEDLAAKSLSTHCNPNLDSFPEDQMKLDITQLMTILELMMKMELS